MRFGAQAEGDVLEHRNVPKQRVMLKHKPDVTFAGGARQRIFAVELHLARIGPIQPGDDAQQRRLAGTRWSQERQQFAGAHFEIDAVECGKIAKAFGGVDHRYFHDLIPSPDGLRARP
jgi:hypothetical protein